LTPIRTFIAIPIPEDIQKYLAEFSEPIREKHDKINWVPQKNIHITVGFLGDTDPGVIDEQAEGIQELIKEFHGMSMGLTDTGIFPHANSPRVLWIGASPFQRSLFDLVEKLKVHLSSLGYELDKRKFQPHITLGRVKSISRHSLFIHEFLSAEVRDLRFPVNKLKWYESELTPTGAVYKELKSFKLNTGGQG